MRILFAAHQFFPEHSAGVEVVTLSLAKELKRRGHEPFVFAAKRSIPGSGIGPGEVQDYEYEGVPVRRVGRPEEGFARPYRLDYENEVMARRVREFVREMRPEIVHAQHFQGLSAEVIPAFKESGVPVIYTVTDFWAFCPVVDLRRHDGALCEGPELEHCVRCITSRHQGSRMKAVVQRTPDAAIRAGGAVSRTPLARLAHPLRQVRALGERPQRLRERMRLVDHFIAYTGLTRDLLLANGIGKGRIEVSHYGIDTSGIPEPPEDRPLPPPLRVGYVGTLAPHKGPDTLLRAFERAPDLDATLAVYGDPRRFPEYAEELREIAAGDGRVSFPGPFPREWIGEVLGGLDVLVAPSRWYENAPGVIFEAFAAGLPVVATDLGGLSEFVWHEENGLLFRLEDEEGLARQLERLCGEPDLLQKLRDGIGPVKTVGENVDELEALYGSLLREGG
ncbi:MAG: glycosyltransferase family 4 protein [Rubrobacter sp.]|nr:glycosyltransferase family 4 protein [Rubrobacter sp.]